jgi:histone deacetylase 1/2
MPLKFWDEAFLKAVFSINRLPSKIIDHDTPFTRLLVQQPDYKFFRMFGCACWPNLHPYNSKKLQFRSQQCVFFGYSNLHKGYKCLNPAQGRVYISRDVVFDETIFPFASMHPNAGARLRAELSILPNILLNPSTNLGDVNVQDQSVSSPVSTNATRSSGGGVVSVEKNLEETTANSGANPGFNAPYFM